jgi:glycosyltransferase involved in cell wall biosynthesis
VVHVSPSYFDDGSMIGGGERYAQSLATAIARRAECVFVTFGSKHGRYRRNGLQVEVYPRAEAIEGVLHNPLCYTFLGELLHADVVHCHQYWTVAANLATLAGKALGKRVFASDHGFVGLHFADRFGLDQFVDGFLAVSSCSARSLPSHRNVQVIHGGVDDNHLRGDAITRREPKVVCVARVMPHKGANYLVQAVDPRTQLDVIGRVYNEPYFALLRQPAQGKKVRFLTRASDEDVLAAYRTATVSVLPSVYQDV